MTRPTPYRGAMRHVRTDEGRCRQCPVTCDRVVYPAGCVDSECERLYTEERDGRVVMGCAAGVYRAEIDIELFELCQRTRHGFGGLRVEREPLEVCRTSVDEAFPHRAESADCSNPEFLIDEMRRRVMNIDASEGAPAGS
jgi:hypothetical protein